jgi:hypothetical protein
LTGTPSIETQHGHPGIVLATLSLANVMALLDLFVVNVALHDIGVGLHYESSLSDVAWVLNAYALFFGGAPHPRRPLRRQVRTQGHLHPRVGRFYRDEPGLCGEPRLVGPCRVPVPPRPRA